MPRRRRQRQACGSTRGPAARHRAATRKRPGEHCFRAPAVRGGHGGGSVFIQGKTKLETREEEYQEVATEQYKVIIATYGVAAVGINLPRIFNLVLVEPGKSFVRVIQSIGRGIRKAEDKDYVQIWDITSSCKYSKRHLTARKRFYKEAKYPYTVSKVKI